MKFKEIKELDERRTQGMWSIGVGTFYDCFPIVDKDGEQITYACTYHGDSFEDKTEQATGGVNPRDAAFIAAAPRIVVQYAKARNFKVTRENCKRVIGHFLKGTYEEEDVLNDKITGKQLKEFNDIVRGILKAVFEEVEDE